MWLTGLRLENYRGIGHARLEFDATTLLVGENDVGKSALLAAIVAVLGKWPQGRPQFVATDIHRPAGAHRALQPASITLYFAEHEAGDWDPAACEALRSGAGIVQGGRRAIALCLHLAPDSLAYRFSVRAPQGAEHPVGLQRVEAIRRLSPLVQIRSTRIHGIDTRRAPDPASLASLLERYWNDLTNARAGDADRELDAGVLLAGRIVQRGLPPIDLAPALARERIAEVLGDAVPARAPVRETPPPAGTAARKIAMLLLAAALEEEGATPGAAGARPLLIVEDPEAHLHPMTLSALWRLLELIHWQKLITTQSGELLAAAPLRGLRRLVRLDGSVRCFRIDPERFTTDELRKFAYHLRIRNGAASFARCWLLVEGETEFWVLSELARVLGYELGQEGVACVEFAQCGVGPLIKMAKELGIQWHLLADGDRAGAGYGAAAQRLLGEDRYEDRITVLSEPDIEHCFWAHGFADVYRHAAGPSGSAAAPARRVIEHAIRRSSKPGLAFALIAAAAERGPASVPAPLARLIECCIRLAREAPARAAQPA